MSAIASGSTTGSPPRLRIACTTRNVLVTGAGGFIGRYLCGELLAQGVAVRGLVRHGRPPVGVQSVQIGDLADMPTLARAMRGVDTVVHLAARVHVMEAPGEAALAAYRRANVAGTSSVLTAAIRAGVERFTFISSVKVVGETSHQPLTEDVVPCPADSYARSKLEAEDVVRELAAKEGLSAPILRLPVVYGPGVRANILRLFELIDRGLPIPVAVDNRRSLIYVGNVVAAIDAVLASPNAARETFFVSDAEPLSTSELVSRIALALGRPLRLLPLPPWLARATGRFAGNVGVLAFLSPMARAVRRVTESLVVSTEKITRVASYAPPFSVDEGLALTAAWYRARARHGS